MSVLARKLGYTCFMYKAIFNESLGTEKFQRTNGQIYSYQCNYPERGQLYTYIVNSMYILKDAATDVSQKSLKI